MRRSAKISAKIFDWVKMTDLSTYTQMIHSTNCIGSDTVISGDTFHIRSSYVTYVLDHGLIMGSPPLKGRIQFKVPSY